MGYSIYIIDRKNNISSATLDYVIERLPTRLTEGFGKQLWGYALQCDVKHTHHKGHGYISVSGSFSMSGKWALDMVLSIQQILQSIDYKIDIYSTDFGYYKKSIAKWLGELDDDIDPSVYGEPFWEDDQ